MMMLLAILFPPVAMFLVGKPFHALIYLVLQLTILGLITAALWALYTVNGAQGDARNKRLIRVLEKTRTK